MAAITLTMRGEIDLFLDAIDELRLIMNALTRRHGDRFRALERRILALERGVDEPVMHDLGEGILVFAPPKQVMDIIADARALGVI